MGLLGKNLDYLILMALKWNPHYSHRLHHCLIWLRQMLVQRDLFTMEHWSIGDQMFGYCTNCFFFLNNLSQLKELYINSNCYYNHLDLSRSLTQQMPYILFLIKPLTKVCCIWVATYVGSPFVVPIFNLAPKIKVVNLPHHGS